MTHNSNDIIAPAITFPSLSPPVKRLFLLPPLSLL